MIKDIDVRFKKDNADIAFIRYNETFHKVVKHRYVDHSVGLFANDEYLKQLLKSDTSKVLSLDQKGRIISANF
ncbi:hypothetical protein [Bacillus atrophaeus]|uniref:hypothetical protein n=1 Tax=Bacillus atrophaeus TaxID=1452 RepID=UPI002E1CED42|nr:hypothetical protein [Bacillus atrophaeus]